MASYEAPDLEQVKTWTGINVRAVRLEESELGTLLSKLLRQAQAEVALIVGEDRFDSDTLTDRQAELLQEAVANGVGYRFLRAPQVARATGTHKPLLVEPSRMIGDVIEECQLAVRNLAKLVANGGGTVVSNVHESGVYTSCPSREPTFQRFGDQW